MVVVKIEGADANTERPRLCKTDEVGELCVSSGASGKEYWVSTKAAINSMDHSDHCLNGGKGKVECVLSFHNYIR